KVGNAPPEPHPDRARFLAECDALRAELAASPEFAPGPASAALHESFRAAVGFMGEDRSLDGDVAAAVRFVEAWIAGRG
ncbi:MAG: hypothetical protein ACK5TT_07305, partial [Lysobacteraceae bacterium]